MKVVCNRDWDTASYLCLSGMLATNRSDDYSIDSRHFQKWLVIWGVLLKKTLKGI